VTQSNQLAVVDRSDVTPRSLSSENCKQLVTGETLKEET